MCGVESKKGEHTTGDHLPCNAHIPTHPSPSTHLQELLYQHRRVFGAKDVLAPQNGVEGRAGFLLGGGEVHAVGAGGGEGLEDRLLLVFVG